MILVTGGAGYIGSHVVKLLSRYGHDTVVFDNLSRGHRDMVSTGEFIEGDLSNKDVLVKIMRERDIDSVIHFAASSLVGESEEDPHLYYRNNLSNGINLLGAMLDTGVKKIVFSSSAAVYGNPFHVPIEEDHPTEPTNVYGSTKLIIEGMLNKYFEAYGIRSVCLRYFNAAGADPEAQIGEDHTPETHLIPLVLDCALGRRKEITVFGTDYETPDGTCIRDYIHVNDLADAHIKALDHIEAREGAFFYNLGNGKGFSVRKVIESTERVTGKKIAIKEGPRRKGDPGQLVASSSKIINDFGWDPKFPDLDIIIETAWRWHRKRFSA
jgi:UDP-glucose 4-epimerase